jgi:DNA mismatch endonuclease (patch repair protein)
MRKNRSGNALEVAFRRELLAALGSQVRFEVEELPGRPDAVVDVSKTAVFLHGCFWHGCPRHGTLPRRNRAFWRAKFERNRARDAQVAAQLRHLGWKVIVVWEHEMRAVGAGRAVLAHLLRAEGRAP